uniref:Pink-eyed dilution-like 2 n=1 Tax=Diaphanoeca grandis TaxID=28014 RepID=A0A1D8RAE9_9EUKA|nr:pink-eyed dilution-like 2 [Diaphanoeca grandis]|eukprot:m.116016 g.116016  ORF g.116016 m.116016 type:complete len:749 (+) comp28474_c0_seq1:287-2533(+)
MSKDGSEEERASLLKGPSVIIGGGTSSRPGSGMAMTDAYGYNPGVFKDVTYDDNEFETETSTFKRVLGKLKYAAKKVWGRKLRTIVLFIMLVVPAVVFAMEEERGGAGHGGGGLSETYVPIGSAKPYEYRLGSSFKFKYMEAEVYYNPGTLLADDLECKDAAAHCPSLNFTLVDEFDEILLTWTIDGSPSSAGVGPTYHHIFKGEKVLSNCVLFIEMVADGVGDDPVAISFEAHGVDEAVDNEVIFGALILLFVYFLIITELIHRTLAAMLGSFITLGVLSALNKRPALSVIIMWIDFETIMLLFGMMIIVGVLAETGAFEYAAVKAYKISKGKVWPLLTMLVMFSAVVSAFLDNVTTILLLTPVTIRMCNVIGLDPIPILLAEVIFSNIGGTATAVGDPPNVIIVSSKWNEVADQEDIDFVELTSHLFVGIVFVTAAAYLQLRFMYRNTIFNNPDSPRVAELKREINIWSKTLRSQGHGGTRPEEKAFIEQLQAKIDELYKDIELAESSDQESWEETVREMEMDAQIKDFDLFYNTMLVLFVVILLFFLHSLPSLHLDLGWIAILGAISLLLISGIQNIEELMMKVEWATLLFFAALFVLIEGLAELGLIGFIGDNTSKLIKDFPEEHRNGLSIVLILWVSAIASSFIDNIPFTTAMIPVIKAIASDPEVNIPMRPLVWALAFGACLGGNGTLIGASANVVMVGLAEQEGITITFNRFFVLGFPMMLGTTTVAMVYLLICHVAFEWH